MISAIRKAFVLVLLVFKGLQFDVIIFDHNLSYISGFIGIIETATAGLQRARFAALGVTDSPQTTGASF